MKEDVRTPLKVNNNSGESETVTSPSGSVDKIARSDMAASAIMLRASDAQGTSRLSKTYESLDGSLKEKFVSMQQMKKAHFIWKPKSPSEVDMLLLNAA